jgi:hypothetical protein
MLVKNGRLHAVQNKNRRFGSITKYMFTYLEDDKGGNEQSYLFTPTQLRVARRRAEENPEDLLRKKFLTDWLD